MNNLYGWAVSQKLPVNDFKWVEDRSQFTKDFMENYNEDKDEGYLLEVDVQYHEKLHNLHNNLPSRYESMKIENIEKLVANLYDKEEYVILIRNLKQALNRRLILKKVHRVIKFNKKAWLKSYIDINTELIKNAKNDFEKDFFKLMNNAVFEKTMENVKTPRDINLVTTEARRNYLVPEPNCHTTKLFFNNFLAIEKTKKTNACY